LIKEGNCGIDPVNSLLTRFKYVRLLILEKCPIGIVPCNALVLMAR